MLSDGCWLIISLVFDIVITTVSAFNTTCPSQCICKSFRTINCSGAIVSDVSFEDIPFQVEELDLSNNNLQSIPQRLQLRYTNIVSLNLSSNRLSFIARTTFGRMAKLRTLDLANNLIRSLSDIDAGILFTGNGELRTLNISGNPIKDLGDGYDQILYSESLQHLDASRCAITQVQGPVALQGLPRLVRLDLSRNPELSRVDGLTSASLQLLDLSSCELQLLRRDTLDGLTALREVRVSGNRRLTDAGRQQARRPASASLQHLDAAYCSIRAGDYAFDLPDIRTVRLKGNLVEELADGALANNTQLETLDLSDNRLRHVHELAFRGAGSLVFVDLSGNRLTTLPTNAFAYAPRLRQLYVAGNLFAVIPPLNASSLRVLDASDCHIDRMAAAALLLLPSLRTLNVSHNWLQRLAAGQLASASLQTLDAAYCRLEAVDAAAIAPLTGLRELDLRGNRLVRVEAAAFAGSRLQRVLLADNPWICDCENPDFRRLWRYLTKLAPRENGVGDSGSGSQPVCHFPQQVAGQLWQNACRSHWPDEPPLVRHSNDLVLLMLVVATLFVFAVVACAMAVRESQRRVGCRRLQSPIGCEEPTATAASRDEGNALSASIGKLTQLPSYDEALLLPKPTATPSSAAAAAEQSHPSARTRQTVVKVEMRKKRESVTQTEETMNALLRQTNQQEADETDTIDEMQCYQNVNRLPVQCTEL